jgi:hypothetical protein
MLTNLATALTVLLLSLFVSLAIRAIRAPRRAAAGFGLALPDGHDASFVQVYGSRNLTIAVAAGLLLALGQTRGLAVLLGCAAVLPLFDMALLRSAGHASPPYARHAVALVLLAVTAALWWLQSA